jgi:hypothetical protein
MTEAADGLLRACDREGWVGLDSGKNTRKTQVWRIIAQLHAQGNEAAGGKPKTTQPHSPHNRWANSKSIRIESFRERRDF